MRGRDPPRQPEKLPFQGRGALPSAGQRRPFEVRGGPPLTPPGPSPNAPHIGAASESALFFRPRSITMRRRPQAEQAGLFISGGSTEYDRCVLRAAARAQVLVWVHTHTPLPEMRPLHACN